VAAAGAGGGAMTHPTDCTCDWCWAVDCRLLLWLQARGGTAAVRTFMQRMQAQHHYGDWRVNPRTGAPLRAYAPDLVTLPAIQQEAA